ncbi:phosphotransferase [Actinopolymorpha sp. NPDC004070]|uniref:phosphotransferase n=1 Tax=Actinopolymorpha sp. NPDC004070 TaxID=3154548 RepID=UPI0033BB212F
MGAETSVPAVGELSDDDTKVWDGHQWEPLWLLRSEIPSATRTCFGHVVNQRPTFMTEGLMNQSWRVESLDGTYVVRVSRSELSREQVAYEHAALGLLRYEVPEVVPPLPGLNGETLQIIRGQVLSLFPYVNGFLGTEVAAGIRWQQAASVLARIHRAGTNLELGVADDVRSVLDQPTTWSTVRPVLQQDLPHTTEVKELFRFLDAEAAELECWLESLRSSGRPLSRGMVHGDFNPRNLIFDKDRLVAVIDWEACHVDVLAYEAALAVQAPDPLAFWQTYLEAGGPLPAEDFDLLGGFSRIRTLSELQFTTDRDGRTSPWAIDVLRDVAGDLHRLREFSNSSRDDVGGEGT